MQAASINYYSRKECCEILSISLPTFHRWVKDGIIKPSKIGGKIYISATELDRIFRESVCKVRRPARRDL